LPQIGGNNLWGLIQRFQKILKIRLVGRDRLAQILRENGLKVRWPKRRTVKTTYSGHRYAVQPNLAKELEVTGPNELWVADITYIPVGGAAAYLFLITDKYSKKIVGHFLAPTLHASGAIEALNAALTEHGFPSGVVHHSDRGVQYCCHDFLDEIRRWELRSSMTDADHCAQNALAECMNGILKREFLIDLGFQSMEQARKEIAEAIWAYNNLRTHGALKGKTPDEVHTGQESTVLPFWLTEIVAFKAHLPYHRFSGVNLNK
jgi:putative transposase